MAGAAIPADMQGKSIVPILKGEGKTPDDWRNAVFYQYSGENTHHVARHDGVRDSRHKLMHFPDTKEWMLFDLEKDPQEMKNVFADPAYSAVAEKMKTLYADLKKQYAANDSNLPMHRLKESWWKDRWVVKDKEIHNSKDAKIVFLGDSITQAWEDTGKSAWDKHFAPLGAVNWGYSGDRTEHLIWRLQNGSIQRLNPKVAVILIGTNNTGHSQRPATETLAGIRQTLNDLSWKWPDTKIILMSIFPRAEKADDPLRQLNDEINEQLKTLVNGKRIHLLDINAKFMNDEGTLRKELLPDLLHLSPAAYDIWADALSSKLNELGL
jgi:N-acetylglucosamine-6-sulfatase